MAVVAPIAAPAHAAFPGQNGKIAFGYRVGEAEVHAVNPDGTDEVNLSNHPSESDGWPAWSPDERRIAFARTVGNVSSNIQIFVMNADGSDQKGLGVNGIEPAWSPDGTRIAFTRGNGTGG
jgi:TolB protein